MLLHARNVGMGQFLQAENRGEGDHSEYYHIDSHGLPGAAADANHHFAQTKRGEAGFAVEEEQRNDWSQATGKGSRQLIAERGAAIARTRAEAFRDQRRLWSIDPGMEEAHGKNNRQNEGRSSA